LELAMAKLFCCRYCRVEFAPVALGDGTAILLCLDCDVIALSQHVSMGARMQEAGERRQTAPSARRRRPPRQADRKRAA
jgi:hypothetical protein